MEDFRTEGITSLIIYMIVSFLILFGIIVVGIFSPKRKEFTKTVFSHWKMASIITIIYFLSFNIGAGLSAISLIWSTGVFCQSLVGLTVSNSLVDFQPFPIVTQISFRWKFFRSCMIMVGIAVIASITIMITYSISAGVGRIFRESVNQNNVTGLLPENGFKAFFATLAGAGIMEGITYRLIVLSFMKKLIKSRFLAILVSAIIFALYHFTPLNMMYRTYWQMPVTEFVYVLLGACIIGFIYLKRGFETSVLSHTLADLIPLLAVLYFL